jgi:hypothetical protein
MKKRNSEVLFLFSSIIGKTFFRVTSQTVFFLKAGTTAPFREDFHKSKPKQFSSPQGSPPKIA